MRISINKSKNFEFVYLIKDFYSNGSRTTKIIEKLGTMDELMNDKKMSRDEVIAWAKDYAHLKTLEEKENQKKISLSLSPSRIIDSNQKRLFNCGYLFLQSLYYQLKMNNICRNIKNHHSFEYDINAILSDLIYSRILSPSSKFSSFEFAHSLLETPKYEIHDVYRALSVLAGECDYIQAEVYKNSHFVCPRNNAVLYYDCSNFYFEIEQEEGLKKYGKSKEHRPNPIVQMGLMMDGDGIPLAFNLFEGNKNEQPSMKPLEQKIIRNFGFSKFVVCTDAGLGSESNRLFNSIEDRAFIVTQSLKKLKKDEMEWALDNKGWKRLGDDRAFTLDEIKKDKDNINQIYYKEEPYTTKKLHQRLIVTYSPKYAAYQKKIRQEQIERAMKMVDSQSIKKERRNPNDPSRFVNKIVTTENGEIAKETTYSLNEEAIEKEARFDGFYAVCTDLLDDDVKDIIKVSEGRWEIEESFRIMKTDFKSRPVYLHRDDRIKAHFLICYLALLIYRLLEKKLNYQYTAPAIIETLRKMALLDTQYEGYMPAYERTRITDSLHKEFEFRTDYEIMTKQNIRSLIKSTKNK